MNENVVRAFIYNTWYEGAKKLSEMVIDGDDENKTLAKARAFSCLEAALDYQFTGTYDQTNPDVIPFMETVKFALDKSGSRYEQSKVNGSTGGRSKSVTKEQLEEYIKQGMCREDIAAACQCTEKTVVNNAKRYELPVPLTRCQLEKEKRKNPGIFQEISQEKGKKENSKVSQEISDVESSESEISEISGKKGFFQEEKKKIPEISNFREEATTYSVFDF